MIIVCWNMQGTGYPSAEMFAELVGGWGADVVIMLEAPDWASRSRVVGSARGARWTMQYFRQDQGGAADRHHGSVVTLCAPGVIVQLKGELYPDAADPRLLAVLKIRKGDEVRRVATCHAPFGGGAYVSYVKNAVRELARFSETPHGAKRHVHAVDIWLGDLNTAGAHSPDDRFWVLKFARPTTQSGAASGAPRDKVLVRTGSDLVERASAGRVVGRNTMAEGADWQIHDWDPETSSDHCPVYINTGGAAPVAVAAAAAEPALKRPSLARTFGDIQDKARRDRSPKRY